MSKEVTLREFMDWVSYMYEDAQKPDPASDAFENGIKSVTTNQLKIVGQWVDQFLNAREFLRKAKCVKL